MGQKGNKLVNNIITYAILILGTVIMLVPFIWMVLTSFKTYAETVKIPVQWMPSAWNLDNYREVLVKLDFIRYYRNTILVTVLTLVLMMFIGSLSAFAFARMNFPLKNPIFYMLLTVFMVPAQMTMIPKYLIVSRMGGFPKGHHNPQPVQRLHHVHAAAVFRRHPAGTGGCRKD